jgi:hypothetical protein
MATLREKAIKIGAKVAWAKASKEGFEMAMIPNLLDAEHIPIENRAGAEEIPAKASIGRPYGKSRLLLEGEITMGTSREVLQAQILTLGQQNLMGVRVNTEQVNQILRMCNNEEDKKALRELCAGFGLQYSA